MHIVQLQELVDRSLESSSGGVFCQAKGADIVLALCDFDLLRHAQLQA